MKTLSKKRKKPSVVFLIGAAFLLFLVLLFIPVSQPAKDGSFSQTVQDINRGDVSSLVISKNSLVVGYKDEKTKKIEVGEGSALDSLVKLGARADKLRNIDVSFQNDSGGWSSLAPFLLSLIPSLIIVFLLWKMLSGAQNNAMQAFDFTQAKAKLFGAGGKKEKEKISFGSVGGLKQAKQELREIVDFLNNPEKYFKIGAQIPKGVLLVGEPGTGKTLLARAIANEAGVPFFSISGSEFIELFVGVGASRVRSLFSQAKRAGRAIIFIDEIDSIGKSRGRGISGGGLEEREQTLNQILTEMDGFERRSEIIVVGATNKPEALDPALLRPGRFDRRIVLDSPDIEDRDEILKIHAKNKKLSSDVNLREIAERTPGFSGADIENLLNEAAILAGRERKESISQEDILNSIEKVLLGPERKSHLLNKEEKVIAAFHEAGHAIVAAFTGTEKVRKVSIVARGLAAGYTLKVPEEEKSLQRRSDFVKEIATLLGGYITEKERFQEVSTGARNDLLHTTRIAKDVVKNYGMSQLGPVSFENKANLTFEETLFSNRQYSEKTAEMIDKEVDRIINEGRKLAEKTIKENWNALAKIANILVEKETIERKEFEDLIKKEV